MGAFAGSHCWGQRLRQLGQKVVQFEPGGRQALNYSRTSSLPVSKVGTSVKRIGTERGGRGREVGGSVEASVEERTEKAWYKEPVVGVLSSGDNPAFNLPFITNLQQKTPPVIAHSDSVSDTHSSGQADSNSGGRGGNGIESQQYSYTTPSILPSPPSGQGQEWVAVRLAVQVGRVMVYCGEGGRGEGQRREGRGEEFGFLRVNHCPVRGLVVYQTEAMCYSVTR